MTSQRPNSSSSEPVQQYFAAQPTAPDIRRNVEFSARGHDFRVQTSEGVFSERRLDMGTSVLLRKAPTLPQTGTFLDLGCGWGPIALTMGAESPHARVIAVDINERAVTLTRENANRNHVRNVHAMVPSDVPADLRFSVIWSNPPIRVGKDELHHLLLIWLDRLEDGGHAYLVVQRNLGADSLISWMKENCGPDMSISKLGSSKGYRLIDVARTSSRSE